MHRRRSLSSLATSPHDSGPRSLIHSQSQLSRATRELAGVKGNTTKHRISQFGHCRGTFVAAKSNGGYVEETSNFRFLQIEMSRAVGAQWFFDFFLHVLQEALCELVEIEPRLVDDGISTECEEEKNSWRTPSRSSALRHDETAPTLARAERSAHSLWLTCRKCGLRWPRVHGDVLTQT